MVYCKGPVQFSRFISTEVKVQKRKDHDSKTDHIRIHLHLAGHEKFSSEDPNNHPKVTAATVERYLRAKGVNLPAKKKVKVTTANLLEMWDAHKGSCRNVIYERVYFSKDLQLYLYFGMSATGLPQKLPLCLA